MDNKHSFVWQVALLKETSLAQRLDQIRQDWCGAGRGDIGYEFFDQKTRAELRTARSRLGRPARVARHAARSISIYSARAPRDAAPLRDPARAAALATLYKVTGLEGKEAAPPSSLAPGGSLPR